MDIFKVLKGKNLQLRLLYLAMISFKIDGEIKSFSDKQKLREFSTTKQASVYSVGDPGSSPGLGTSPGEGNGNPLQYSCLENPMDREAWWVTVHGVSRVRYDLATKPPPPPHIAGGNVIRWSRFKNQVSQFFKWLNTEF